MKKHIIAILGLLFISTTSFAQGLFYNVSSDARTLSLGGSGVSSSASAYSIFNNTAATVLSEDKFAVGVNYMNWQPSDLAINSMALGAYYKPIDAVSIALGVRYEFNTMDELSGDNLVLGTYTPYNMTVDLGVGVKIINGLSAAVNLRYIDSRIYKDNAAAFGADIQFMYNIKRTTIGLSVNNIGTKSTYNEIDSEGNNHKSILEMPTNLKLGASHNYLKSEMHELTSVLELGYVLAPEGSDTFFGSLGLEYGFKDMLFVRAAYSLADSDKFIPSHLSCGIGVKYAGVTLDLAYLTTFGSSVLNNTFSVNLSYGF